MTLASRFAISFIMALAMAGQMYASTSAAFFDRNAPQALRWESPIIKVALSTSLIDPNLNLISDSDVLSAVRRSFAAWEDAADIKFELVVVNDQDVSPLGQAGDGVSLITIAQSPENISLFSQNTTREAARTRIFYSPDGFITEADIVLNPFEQFSSDGTFGTFDLESTLTHEIGHLLGLRHSKVLGATMSDSLARNGLFGLSETRHRTLTDADVSAVRDLYGAGNDDLCCASIKGRLLTAGNRQLSKNLNVWATDSYSGRVLGYVDVEGDGSFMLNGLPASQVSVYWQSIDDEQRTSYGLLSSADLNEKERAPLIGFVSETKEPFSLNYIGRGVRLTNSAITLSRDKEHRLLIGGSGIDPLTTTIAVISPFFNVEMASAKRIDLGRGIVALEIIVNVGYDTPTGAYSVVASRRDGSRSALIGAINVE